MFLNADKISAIFVEMTRYSHRSSASYLKIVTERLSKAIEVSETGARLEAGRDFRSRSANIGSIFKES